MDALSRHSVILFSLLSLTVGFFVPVIATELPHPDPRLAQSVTYTSGSKRLSAVAGDLARMTGVTISAGATAQDWRVRDIPVIVCVKDLRLGVLLSTIATATHTSLSAKEVEKSDGEAKTVYRFRRSKRQQDSITNSMNVEWEQQKKDISWAWDALHWLAEHQEMQSRFASRNTDIGEVGSALSKVIATLGSDTKAKLLAGETVTVDSSNAAQSTLLRELNMLHWKRVNRLASEQGRNLDLPTEEDVNNLSLMMKLRDGGEGGRTDIQVSLYPAEFGGVHAGLAIGISDLSLIIEKALVTDCPPRPKVKGFVSPESERPDNAAFSLLTPSMNSELPELTKNVTLPKPEGTDVHTYADELTALAQTAGLNIICEEFVSHRCGYLVSVNDAFGYATTAAALLKQAYDRSFNSWFIDERNKLLVGWSRVDWNWRKHHINLVPARIIDGLLDKLESGVEIDDITPTSHLTTSQRNEWFFSNPRLFWLIDAFPEGDVAVWQIYDTLTPDDKVLAKTDSGLPLSKFASAELAAFFKDKQEQMKAEAFPGQSGEKGAVSDAQKRTRLYDPDTLLMARLRIRRVEATEHTYAIGRSSIERYASGDNMPWDSRLHHSYTMEIECQEDGKRVVLHKSSPRMAFPVYSLDREAELMKKLPARN